MRVRINSLLFSIFILLSGCATTLSSGIATQPQVQDYINELVSRYQFDRSDLNQIFSKVQYQPQIIQLMQTPGEAKPWYIYRKNFITDARVKAGVKFWKEHAQILAQAEREYGVPANIIVGILGVETYYGPMQGRYRVIDALSTLTFGYPPRSAFFKKELTHFLLMAREANVNPEQFHGSYAGAFGKAQFMPSSYRRYAVAFQHTGYSDIINNDADAIASIANYFKVNGWKPGAAIAVPAKVSGSEFQTLKGQEMKPSRTIAMWEKIGVKPLTALPLDAKAAFLKLQLQQGQEYWLGLHNFYVLSRYNPRLNYAMVVYQLSEKIAASYY